MSVISCLALDLLCLVLVALPLALVAERLMPLLPFSERYLLVFVACWTLYGTLIIAGLRRTHGKGRP